MTRKDYDRIAKAIATGKADIFQNEAYSFQQSASLNVGANYVIARIADMLEDDNPRFNRQMFLDACDAWDKV